MPFSFKVNGVQFTTATKAHKKASSLIREQGSAVIHCNNEAIAFADLGRFVSLEKQEKAHNKRQGL